MPQTEFYAEKGDEEKLVHGFLRLGFAIVPSLTYDTQELIYLRDFEGYEQIRPRASLFFAVHKEWMLSPLLTYRIGGTGWNAGKYAIYQRQGGPSLSFLCLRPYEKDGGHWLPSGNILCYPTYRNTVTGEHEKIPSALRAKYHEMRKLVMEGSHMVEYECLGGGSRRFYLMPRAHDAVASGARLVGTTFQGLKVAGLEAFPWALEEARPFKT